MLSTENLERLSKFVGVLNELAKVTAMGVLALLAMGAIAKPEWVKGRLASLGVEIKEISVGPLKVVAKATVKAGGSTLQMAEALTEAELRLTELSTNGQQTLSASNVSAVGDTLKAILVARAALDEQSVSIQDTGKVAGVLADPPKRGWLYVGLFSANGQLKLASSRLESKNGVRFAGSKLAELVLRFDAPVVSDGDDCTKTDVLDYVPPNPNAPERKYAVLRASPEPLKILLTKACNAPGGNQTIYAQVDVPANRVRFAALSSLPQ